MTNRLTLGIEAECEEFRETEIHGYCVSNFGRVVSTKYGRRKALAMEVDKDGYLKVHTSSHGKAAHHHVHRLVACAFLGAPEAGQVVAHNDGTRTNNNAANLRWATQAENLADKVGHGTDQIGSRHGNASTDELAVARVKAALRRGLSTIEAAKHGPVSYWVACDIRRGRTWRHVA